MNLFFNIKSNNPKPYHCVKTFTKIGHSNNYNLNPNRPYSSQGRLAGYNKPSSSGTFITAFALLIFKDDLLYSAWYLKLHFNPLSDSISNLTLNLLYLYPN
jgi:hypothetical protein